MQGEYCSSTRHETDACLFCWFCWFSFPQLVPGGLHACELPLLSGLEVPSTIVGRGTSNFGTRKTSEVFSTSFYRSDKKRRKDGRESSCIYGN